MRKSEGIDKRRVANEECKLESLRKSHTAPAGLNVSRLTMKKPTSVSSLTTESGSRQSIVLTSAGPGHLSIISEST